MIARIFSLVVNGGIYMLAASMLTQIILGSYLWRTWKMDENTAMRMLAIAQGIDLFARPEEAPSETDPSAEQASLDQIIKQRAGNVRDIEKREQELKNTKALLVAQQLDLVREQDNLAAIRTGFETKMKELEEGAVMTGRSRDLKTFKGLKPPQAKQFLMAMLDDKETDDVVILMSSIPDRERLKIIAQFQTEEELERIAEVLKLIRYGAPEITAVQETLAKLNPPAPV